jgi:hypothetical protein
MWNNPSPAPELRLLTIHRQRSRQGLETLLGWDFDLAIIAHGELLDANPKAAIQEAWSWLLD